MPYVPDNDRSPPELMPIWIQIISLGRVSRPVVIDCNTPTPEQAARIELDAAHQDLARAREDLAATVRAQDPDRHFKGLPESEAVIAAYDAVRAAETVVARLEKGRRA